MNNKGPLYCRVFLLFWPPRYLNRTWEINSQLQDYRHPTTVHIHTSLIFMLDHIILNSLQ